MAGIKINPELCKGCGICIEVCPKKVLGFDKEQLNSKGYSPASMLKPDDCVGCAACARMCPDCAIYEVYR